MAQLRLAVERLRWFAIEEVVAASLGVRRAHQDLWAADLSAFWRLVVATLVAELFLASLVYSFLRLHGQA
jgi:hypothetical protein